MNVNEILNRLKRYPLAVICALVLFICIILIVLRGSVVAELSMREADLNARIHTIEENAKSSTGLEADVEELDARVVAINERLFVRDERAINTNFFYSLEDEVDVVISGVSQLSAEDPGLSKGGPNELKLHSAIVYEISVKGSFRDLLKFLFHMHQVDPLIRVSEFEINSSRGGGTSSGDLDAKLRVLVLSEKN